ncbi:MAG: response regulator, partial [Candidatus Cloacimonadota bacterium]|nr:response regulator [Candidatus Cloacimonadota bacterium]
MLEQETKIETQEETNEEIEDVKEENSDKVQDSDKSENIESSKEEEEEIEKPKKKILAIDDKKIMTIILKKALSSNPNYEIRTINESTKVIEEIDEFHPDLITCDINMPDVSGIDIVRELRANDKYANIKIVMVSSDYRDQIMEELSKIGVNSFCKKPFKKEEIINVIAEL